MTFCKCFLERFVSHINIKKSCFLVMSCKIKNLALLLILIRQFANGRLLYSYIISVLDLSASLEFSPVLTTIGML